MTDWAAPPKKKATPKRPPPTPQPQRVVEDVQDVGGGGGPLAEAQAAMDRSKKAGGDGAGGVDGFTAPSEQMPHVEELPQDSDSDGPKPRVDIDDPETRKKLNPNQVVMGTAQQ